MLQSKDTTAFHEALMRKVHNGSHNAHDLHWVISRRTGQRVGIIYKELGIPLFQRLVSEETQRLRMFGGAWALEIDLLDHVEKLGAKWYRIITTDTERMLHAPLQAFRERGKTINMRYGMQIALPERYFHDHIITDPDPDSEEPVSETSHKLKELQLSLFGGAL